MAINVVILAAGQGKRMKSALPKVLHCLAGKPLLAHVIDTARTLKPGRICVVYGHGGSKCPWQCTLPTSPSSARRSNWARDTLGSRHCLSWIPAPQLWCSTAMFR